MGEIGTPRKEYLYELRYIDLLMIERGYDRRHRHPWAIARWMTYNIMQAQCGSKAMREAGINSIEDLLKFPWDSEPVAPITSEERDEMLAEINAYNAALAAKQNE